MSIERQISALTREVMELKALILQMRPEVHETSAAMEIALCKSQGVDLAEHLKAKQAVREEEKMTFTDVLATILFGFVILLGVMKLPAAVEGIAEPYLEHEQYVEQSLADR